MIWIIILLIHIALTVLAYVACKKSNESEWVIFWALCIIPLLGPAFVIYLYAMNKVREQQSKLNEPLE